MGLSEATVELLMTRHAPMQIERGLTALAGRPAKVVADAILRGRWGFRKGYKKALNEGRSSQAVATEPPALADEEVPCHEQRQEALEQVLLRLRGEVSSKG
jgi:hypothetical protein